MELLRMCVWFSNSSQLGRGNRFAHDVGRASGYLVTRNVAHGILTALTDLQWYSHRGLDTELMCISSIRKASAIISSQHTGAVVLIVALETNVKWW